MPQPRQTGDSEVCRQRFFLRADYELSVSFQWRHADGQVPVSHLPADAEDKHWRRCKRHHTAVSVRGAHALDVVDATLPEGVAEGSAKADADVLWSTASYDDGDSSRRHLPSRLRRSDQSASNAGSHCWQAASDGSSLRRVC